MKHRLEESQQDESIVEVKKKAKKFKKTKEEHGFFISENAISETDNIKKRKGKVNLNVEQSNASEDPGFKTPNTKNANHIGKNKDKKFQFKAKFGEKKGNKGAFSPKKVNAKDLSEVDKKELRKKQKLLRKQRREKERGYAVPDEAKKIFEEMRCSKCPADKRVELSVDLFNLLSGKITSAVRSHDLARMVQWLIKVGPPDIKSKVIDEVIEDTVNLCKTKYSNHIVQRILHDGDKSIRKRILSYFIGNISKLMGNRFAAPVVEEYYLRHAKSKEKAYMRQELYSDLFRGGKNPSLTSLQDVLTQNPSLTGAILKSTKSILSKLIDKKSSLCTNLVADVLYDYLQHCEEQDKLDLLEILKSNIQILLKTKSGNRILMLLLWESTAKVKKSIVKELKTQVLQIAKSGGGNVFLCSLFDSVDDTVLIKKAILPTILDSVEELVQDNNGRKVILYLVAHRDTAYFHPQELEALRKADESENVKKDISVKEKELLAPCVDAVLLKIKDNPEFWFSEPYIAVVSLAALKKGQGEVLIDTFKTISEFISKCITEDNLKVIEDAGIHMIFKKLIKKDGESGENLFAEHLVSSLSIDNISKLATINRGCFLLVHLIETNSEIIITKIKKLFKKSKIVKKLESLNTKGSEILRKLISDKSIV